MEPMDGGREGREGAGWRRSDGTGNWRVENQPEERMERMEFHRVRCSPVSYDARMITGSEVPCTVGRLGRVPGTLVQGERCARVVL